MTVFCNWIWEKLRERITVFQILCWSYITFNEIIIHFMVFYSECLQLLLVLYLIFPFVLLYVLIFFSTSRAHLPKKGTRVYVYLLLPISTRWEWTMKWNVVQNNGEWGLKRARDMKLKLEIELGLLQYFLEDWELESME